MTESIQDTSPRIHSESRLRTGEIKNLYPMKLAERIYPWGQGFNLKSQISNLKSIDLGLQAIPYPSGTPAGR